MLRSPCRYQWLDSPDGDHDGGLAQFGRHRAILSLRRGSTRIGTPLRFFGPAEEQARGVEFCDDVIVLRPWREEGASAVYEACQGTLIQRWIPLLPSPYTREDAYAFVTGARDGEQDFAIVREGPSSARSRCMSGTTVRPSIGYWCAEHARGRGIVTRALRRLCQHAFDDLALQRLWVITDPDNAASQRVVAKAGFQREGVMRSHVQHPDGRRRDSVLFSLLPGELRQPN